MDLFAEIRKSFVDREKVRAAMQRGKKRGLSKFGAHLRQRSKTSIRKRKKSSPSGQPPSAHVSKGLRLIFFAWDDKTESVVVGPISFAAKRIGGGIVPKLLEAGGDVTRSVPVPKAMARVASDVQKASFLRKIKDGSLVLAAPARMQKSFHYAGNPYMAPALEAEKSNFPKLFANTVQ